MMLIELECSWLQGGGGKKGRIVLCPGRVFESQTKVLMSLSKDPPNPDRLITEPPPTTK